MLIASLLTTSALAFTASAFLIPAEVANIDVEVNHHTPDLTHIELPCTNCPYALASERNGKHEWINGVPNILMFSLATEGNRLMLNNIPIFPITRDFTAIPTAKQLKWGRNVVELAAMDEKFGKGYEGELTLSYSSEFVREQALEDTDVKVLETKFQVLAIDSELVEVPVMNIQLHRQPDGAVSLPPRITAVHPAAHIDNVTKKHVQLSISGLSFGPSTISNGGKQCTTLFCRIVADMMSKVQAAKSKAVHLCQKVKACLCKLRLPAGFAKHPPTPPGTDAAEHPHGPQHLGSHHHHMGPGSQPHHRHHHHGLHRFLHGVKRVFKHFVLPALVGVAAGMAACAVGMLVGQTAMFLWMKARGKGAYGKVEQAPEYEKEGLVTAAGLPKYEEVETVVFVEVEKNEVV